MHWPQITYIIVAVFGLGASAARHGKSKVSEENFWSSLIASAFIATLLYYGGFFSH